MGDARMKYCGLGPIGCRLLFLLLFFVTPFPASAQLARVEGRAVNGANGGPIAGASIRLCAQPVSGKTMAVGICTVAVSDHNGRFIFSKAKLGHFYLASEAKGYLKNYLVQNGKGGSDFDLHAGESRSFRFVLWPEGTISGRIVDENGKPIAGIDVSAIRDDSSLGRRFISHYQYWGGPSEVATDKNGEFTIGELKPGRYYLEAGVAPWRIDDGTLLKAGSIPAYYPGSSMLAAASVLCIDAGEQRKVEFPLKPALTYSARGKIELPADYKRDFEPLWGLRREDGQYYGQWTDEEFDHPSGTWEIRHLPRGTYHLELQSGIYDTDLVANKSFTITDADVNDLVLPMRLRFSLRAKVHLPESFHPSTPYSVLFKLEPDGTAELTEDGQPLAKDGEVAFSRLQPGHYKLYLFTDDPVYIKSATFGDQDALNNGLLLRGPSDEVLDITLASSKTDLSGVVTGDGEVPVAGADVKLLAQGEDAPYVIKSVVADGAGHFVMKAVPPGRYNLIALSEAVRDREFGTFEFDQVKRWAMPVQVRDVSVTGVLLKSTNLRYAAAACNNSLAP
jgi:hypothetical protein